MQTVTTASRKPLLHEETKTLNLQNQTQKPYKFRKAPCHSAGKVLYF